MEERGRKCVRMEKMNGENFEEACKSKDTVSNFLIKKSATGSCPQH